MPDGMRRCKRCLYGFLTLMMIFSIFPSHVFGASTKERKKIRVGYYIAPNFQEYDAKTGMYSGSSYEYLVALRQYTNWEYEFVPVDFSEGVKMLEEGKLDLMNNVSKTKEREQVLGFSSYESGTNYGCIIVDVDNPDYAYNDYESFNSMRVGILETSIFRSYFDAYCKEHKIQPKQFLYKNDEAMSDALKRGEIDARVVSSSYEDGSRTVARFAPMSYYFATPKKDKSLLKELNEAMIAIETDMPNYAATLEKRYEKKVVEKNVVLSQTEKEYVKKHKTVTVAVSGAWYPIFYYNEKGEVTGPLADIYHKIEKATGLEFKAVKYKTYNDSLKAVKAGKVDMIVECAYDFVYANQWNIQLSDQVNGIEFYQIINENNRKDKVKTIAFYGEPYLEAQVKKKYGDSVKYIKFSNAEQAVNAVLSGDADCTFANYYTSTKFQNQGRYISLKYVLIPSLKYNFGLGISNDTDPRLKSLIGKGLHTIDSTTIENMFLNSALVETKPDLQAMLYQNPLLFAGIFCIIVAAVLIIIFLLILHKRKTKVIGFEQEQRRKTEDALEQAQRANASKTEFFARMSHDMRTPMNGILGLTALSKNEEQVDALKENMIKIDESGKYLLGIINDTLDFQRIESGNLALDLKVTDCRKTIETAINMVRPAIDEKHIDFQVVNQGVILDCDVRIDPVRMKQIFVNLISNAIKFTPEGGSIFFIFECMGRDGMVAHDRFIIRDTGVGMSQEFIEEKIFQPFSQEHNSMSEQYAGSGLGLSIVKNLVELMNGTIEVESELGKGTTFTVCMDIERVDQGVVKDHTQDKAKKLEVMKKKLDGCKILMAEDHALNAEIASRLLQKVGCVVTWVKDGQECVNHIKENPPGTYDLILMDLRMPVMDGLTATKEIRELDMDGATTIPIVAMTANAYDSDVKNCLEAGMNAHIAKPIQPMSMYEKIASQIKERKF